MFKKDLGHQGEALAQKYLKKQGYKIIDTNFSCKSGEIDIIAKDNGVLVFVEVRSKTKTDYGSPIDTIDAKKQQKIKKTAQQYLLQLKTEDIYCRFDVVAILWRSPKPEIVLYRDAFW